MMNALELKENKKELIFIVNEQIIDEKINTFIMMLEKYGKVVKMSEFSDYILIIISKIMYLQTI